MSNIKPLTLICPACFGAGVDVTNHDDEVPCVLCDGMAVVTALQAQEWRDVCGLILLGTGEVPSSLKHWQKYIQAEIAKHEQ